MADGARDNWDFLESHTDIQTIDFFHVTGYLGNAALVMFKGKKKIKSKEEWLNDSCHDLKHKQGAAGRVLKEMENFNSENKLTKRDKEQITSAITYFSNNKTKMKWGGV